MLAGTLLHASTSDPGPRVPEFRWAQRAGTLHTPAHIRGRLPSRSRDWQECSRSPCRCLAPPSPTQPSSPRAG
eukprot:scaffold106093_cov63-Phaeocystis_antarctica.AAC.6